MQEESVPSAWISIKDHETQSKIKDQINPQKEEINTVNEYDAKKIHDSFGVIN